MIATLLKQPFDVSFAGNPMPFIFQVAPYDLLQQSQDINLTARVQVENIFNSGVFDEVYLQKLYPTDSGKIEIDIASIINAYLEYYTPRPGLRQPVQCSAQRKRYRVTAILQNNNIQAGDLITSDILHAIKGGLAYEAWHYKEFFSKIVSIDKQPLLFSAGKEAVDPDALKFMYWVYPFSDGAEQTITYKIYLSDGATAILVNPTKIIAGLWSVNCVPVGFSQVGLNAIIPLDKSVVKYSVTITTATDTIVAEYFFELDSRNFYDPYYLMYRNSIGGLETVRLLGQVDLAAAYARQQAQRTIPPVWYNPNLLAQIKDEAAEETFSYAADTGFMSKEQLMKMRDLLLSKEIYQIASASQLQNGLADIPIVITSSKTKFFSNKDNLVSMQIEWQQAFVNSFFTPARLMPGVRTCPAVEKFIVTQLTKKTLQILWALEIPYTQIEVQLLIGTDTYTYNYTGNTGKMIQSFENPATTVPVDITIKARCVCDPESVPIDFGPYTIPVLSVRGNSLPVAVDDHFTIASGRTAAIAIPISALANDYDPDGDAIEAIADWGITTKAAVWTIDKAGFITFLTNLYSFTGDDYFDYQIREVGDTTLVTARVYITVGTGPQAIYVKVVQRNVGTSHNVTDGEVWLDFFSDPAGTIPLDLTSLQIPITVRFTRDFKKTCGGASVYTSSDNIFYTRGTKMKIYTGELYMHYNCGGLFGGSVHAYYTFTALPGTGYSPI